MNRILQKYDGIAKEEELLLHIAIDDRVKPAEHIVYHYQSLEISKSEGFFRFISYNSIIIGTNFHFFLPRFLVIMVIEGPTVYYNISNIMFDITSRAKI